MSKIDDLIAKCCPNGIEYCKLEKLATIDTGKQLNKELLFDSGKYPVMNGGIYPSGRYDEYNSEKNNVAISQGGASAGYVNWMTENFWAGAHCYVLTFITDNILKKYVYYILKNHQDEFMKSQQGAGIPSLSRKKLNELQVPVPPLAVQEEIVNILDSFTLLEAELEAELEARKKQYEHYRDKLLNFADISQGGVRTMAINQLCEVSRGRVMSKDYLRENIGDYPVYSSQTANNGELGKINTFDYDGEYLTWTTDGANAGSVFYRNGKFSVTNVCGLLKSKTNDVSMKYLSYCLGNVAKKYVNEGMGNPKLMSNVMEKIKVPVPPLAEQERIVSILDKFDALVNDISDGLPAEINARRQQYEYYRNKLLNFEPMAA